MTQEAQLDDVVQQLVNLLSSSVAGDSPELDAVRNFIVQTYIPLETNWLRCQVADRPELSGIRLVLRPSGRFEYRVHNKFVKHDEVLAIPNTSRSYARREVVTRIYQSIQLLLPYSAK